MSAKKKAAGKLKPRVMWAFISTKGEYLSLSARNDLNPDHFEEGTRLHRVLVLPLDDINGLVDRTAGAMYADWMGWRSSQPTWADLKTEDPINGYVETFTQRARAALRAIGIPVGKRGGK